MSGVKRLAAAVATEPSFISKIKGFTKQELAEFVPTGDGKKSGPQTKKLGSKKY